MPEIRPFAYLPAVLTPPQANTTAWQAQRRWCQYTHQCCVGYIATSYTNLQSSYLNRQQNTPLFASRTNPSRFEFVFPYSTLFGISSAMTAPCQYEPRYTAENGIQTGSSYRALHPSELDLDLAIAQVWGSLALSKRSRV